MESFSIRSKKLPPLRIDCKNGHVSAVHWNNRASTRRPTPKSLKPLRRDLEAYFAGECVDFDWPFDWEQGTPFQQEVWQALRRVPYGETRSYAWIAEQVGRPQAVRAVGNANGRNPFSLVVPCHRIICSDGSIGGYTGGLAIKQRLLEIERLSS